MSGQVDSAKQMKIACIGEVMVELVAKPDGAAQIGVAGDTYNTAVYLKKLSTQQASSQPALDISYVTALGTDLFSQRITAEIERHGLGSTHIDYRDAEMPGLYAIDTDDKGERSFSYWRSQAAARSLFQEPCNVSLSSLMSFDVIYLSGITMAILWPETRDRLMAFLSDFRAAGGKVAFDSNYRPRLWEDAETARKITMAMWALADIALPSLDDEMALFDDKSEADVLARLHKAGVRYGALKRGAEGPLALNGESLNDEANGEAGEAVYAAVTNITDTTAAGDSFNAGFLYGYATTGAIEDALQIGHALAAEVIQSSGAIVDSAIETMKRNP